jgi:isopentenyl-diphosphate Delta-isomerase
MPPSGTATMATVSGPSAHKPAETDIDLSKDYDDEQVRLMEEECIVIDVNDNPLGAGSKKTCTRSHQKG